MSFFHLLQIKRKGNQKYKSKSYLRKKFAKKKKQQLLFPSHVMSLCYVQPKKKVSTALVQLITN